VKLESAEAAKNFIYRFDGFPIFGADELYAKPVFLSQFCMKTNILPSQARDKHIGNTQKKRP
jgi:hypothetical protein